MLSLLLLHFVELLLKRKLSAPFFLLMYLNTGIGYPVFHTMQPHVLLAKEGRKVQGLQ